uniref:Uncharacterized protein n=1 Tax=Oryza brachyantha TaxID=4533 RepID=J3L057_ORYBR
MVTSRPGMPNQAYCHHSSSLMRWHPWRGTSYSYGPIWGAFLSCSFFPKAASIRKCPKRSTTYGNLQLFCKRAFLDSQKAGYQTSTSQNLKLPKQTLNSSPSSLPMLVVARRRMRAFTMEAFRGF